MLPAFGLTSSKASISQPITSSHGQRHDKTWDGASTSLHSDCKEEGNSKKPQGDPVEKREEGEEWCF